MAAHAQILRSFASTLRVQRKLQSHRFSTAKITFSSQPPLDVHSKYKPFVIRAAVSEVPTDREVRERKVEPHRSFGAGATDVAAVRKPPIDAGVVQNADVKVGVQSGLGRGMDRGTCPDQITAKP